MPNDVAPPKPAWQASGRAAPPRGAGDCALCPLRARADFQDATADELSLINRLKLAEPVVDAGTVLIHEGAGDAPLFTLLQGWAIRYKTLDDGRRQIVNVMLPGDFIGLQQKLSDGANHGVQAVTAVRLCRFARDAVWALHREAPSLGYDVTWLSAHEGALLDDNLLSVGRRSALERVAALLLTLHSRAAPFDPAAARSGLSFPLTRQHLADAMGLSLVHTQRSLRTLERRGLVEWRPGPRLALPDPAALARVAHLRWPLRLPARPLI